MATNNLLPVAVAYFTVRVPSDNGIDQGRAQEIVERYLYQGSVVDIDVDVNDFNHPAYVVTVRIENYRSAQDVASAVQIQRDRFSSGLYSSTEPKILFTPFAEN